MKKTIRLTESELVKLVQRIIKEDEMSSSNLPFTPKLTVKDIMNEFDNMNEGMMVLRGYNALVLDTTRK